MEVIEKLNYSHFKEENKKSQILLTHTSRNLIDYMVSLKYRFGGRPIKLPHYFVDREGKIIHERVNAKSIVISLENLGWLEKVPLKNHYINWIGNIYKGNIVDRKWRDYFFWQPYTEIQLKKTAELCKSLSKEVGISLNCIGHNTKVKGCESFLGILTKSNFDEFATDISPAFNFEEFKKLLENE